MSTAKILVINSIGPVLVEVVTENSTEFKVKNPVQLVPVDETQMSFNPLLDFMVDDDVIHTVYKSSVSVEVSPNTKLGESYLQAMNPNKIFVPESKKLII